MAYSKFQTCKPSSPSPVMALFTVSRVRPSNIKFQILDFGFWILDFRFSISDFRFQISDFDFGFRISYFRFPISDFTRAYDGTSATKLGIKNRQVSNPGIKKTGSYQILVGGVNVKFSISGSVSNSKLALKSSRCWISGAKISILDFVSKST